MTPLTFELKKHAKMNEVLISIRFDTGCHGDEECHDYDGEIDELGAFGNTLGDLKFVHVIQFILILMS